MRRGLRKASPSLMTLCLPLTHCTGKSLLLLIPSIGNVSWQQLLYQSPLSHQSQSHMKITRERKAECFKLDWKLCDVHIGQLTMDNSPAACQVLYNWSIKGVRTVQHRFSIKENDNIHTGTFYTIINHFSLPPAVVGVTPKSGAITDWSPQLFCNFATKMTNEAQPHSDQIILILSTLI